MSNKYPGGFVSLGGQVGYSVNFNGTNQYLQLPVNSAFDLGTNACCIEAWVYISSASEFGLFCTSSGASGQTRPNFVVSTTGLGADYFGNPFLSFSATISLGKWTHVAFTRASTNGAWRGFVNGVMIGYNATGTQNLLQTTVAQNIGRYASTYYTNGNISNLRITNGSVPTLYQTASTTTGTVVFTPPTQLFAETNTVLLTCSQPVVNDQSTNNFTITNFNGATVSGINTPFTAYNPNLLNPALGAATPGVWTLDQAMNAEVTRSWPMYDPYYKNVVLNLHGEGTNGAQNNTFVDSSASPLTITRNGNTTQGSFSPYGQGWSNYFVSGYPYVSFPSVAGYNFGTGDFTVEFWFNVPSSVADSARFISNAAYTSSGIDISYDKTNSRVNWYIAGVAYATSSLPSANAWHHIAFSRSGTTLYIFVDGVLSNTYTSMSSNITSAGALYIGTYTGGGTPTLDGGYMSNVRLVKGTALYTSSFTPSTTPLTAVTNTTLLTCQSNRFIDNSSTAATATVNGIVQVQRFQPFLFNTSYTPSTIGGSGYFDGSGDYLTVPNTSPLQVLGGSFTLDCWIYLTAAQANMGIIGIHDNSTAGYFIRLDTSIIRFYTSAATVDRTYAFAQNTWYHIAVVSSGTTGTLYINGVAQGATFSTNGTQDTTDQFIIGKTTTLTNYFTGYISDVRVIKGSAVVPPVGGPTAPLTAVTNTQLLCNFTNAAIYDNAMMNDLETVGNAQISTSVKKYGTGSMYFDGTGDYLVSNAASTNLYAFGTGDFTIEFWFNTSVLGGSTDVSLIDLRASGSNGAYPYLYIYASKIRYWFNSADRIVQQSTLSAGTWYHVALARQGSSTRLFVNGTQEDTTYTNSDSCLVGSQRPIIGASTNLAYLYTGYIDDLRITKGVARYVANFTPPTSQLQDQ